MNTAYDQLRNIYRYFRYLGASLYYAYFRRRYKFNLLSREETIRRIVEEKCSVARFGDGEFGIIQGHNSSFQKTTPELGKALRDVLDTDRQELLVCLPIALVTDAHMNYEARRFWRGYIFRNRKFLSTLAGKPATFGDTNFTRFYIDLKDKSTTREYISRIKEIWKDRDLLIVEGKASRLGVGNDLFENAKSIRRILCPPVSAYDKYDEIVAVVKQELAHNGDILVLIALGMTATVMARDLCAGGQFIDIGHVDVEYCWYRMKAKKKCPIPSKAVNECGDNKVVFIDDEDYLNSIIAEI